MSREPPGRDLAETAVSAAGPAGAAGPRRPRPASRDLAETAVSAAGPGPRTARPASRAVEETAAGARGSAPFADTVDAAGEAPPPVDPSRTRVSGRAPARGSLPSAGSLTVGVDAAEDAGDGSLPRRVGRFAILRRLGSGGMGTVYAAFDEELGRRVAIKVLHLALSRDEGRAMLRAEAQAMARLSHVHVVQIYELGVHEGQIFLVMEYIDGQTLSEWLGARERGWQAIVARFVDAGEGLAAAHRAGIIHRDFKPEYAIPRPERP